VYFIFIYIFVVLEKTEGAINKKYNPEKLGTRRRKNKKKDNMCWIPQMNANEHK
jgi:hypothetical protein